MAEFQSGADIPPPPNMAGTATVRRERPWWGIVDVVLAVPVVLAAAVIGGLVGGLVAFAAGNPIDADLPVYALFLAVLFQQIGQAGWPIFVSRFKGLGLAKDWWFKFDLPKDIGWGLLLAVACLIGSQLATLAAQWAVSLPEDADPSNTGILTDNQDSLWLIGIILLVTVGAPISEELLFRGLVLQGILKHSGHAVAVIGSSVIFTLPHVVGGASLDERLVLWAGIFAIGVILAVGVLRTGRLGPAVIGHLLFNTFGTIAALAM